MDDIKFKISLILVFIFVHTTIFAQYHEIKWSKKGINYTAFALEEGDDNIHVRLNIKQNNKISVVKFNCDVKRGVNKMEWISESAIYIIPENHRNYKANNFVFELSKRGVGDSFIAEKSDIGQKRFKIYAIKCKSNKSLKAKELTSSYLLNFFKKDDPFYANLLLLKPISSSDIKALKEISISSLLETIHTSKNYSNFKIHEFSVSYLKKLAMYGILNMNLIERTDIINRYLSNHYILPDSDIVAMLYKGYREKIKCSNIDQLIGAIKIVKGSRITNLRMKNKNFLYEQFDLLIDSYVPSASQNELAYLLKQNCLEKKTEQKIKAIYLAKRSSDLTDLKNILNELEKRDIEKSKTFTIDLVEDLKKVFKDQVKLYVDEEEESIGGKAIPFAAEYLGLADNYYWQNWNKHFGPFVLKNGIDKYNSAQISDKREYLRRLNKRFPSYRIHIPNMAFPLKDFNKGIENDVKNSFKSPDLNMLDLMKAIWSNKKEVLSSVAVEGGIYQVAKMLAVKNPYVMPVYITRDILVMFKTFKDVCEEKEREIYDKTIISYSVEISSAYSNFIAFASKSNTDYYNSLYKAYERAYDENMGLKKRIELKKEKDVPNKEGLIKLELYR